MMTNVEIENGIVKKAKAKRGRPAKKKVEEAVTLGPMCCNMEMSPVGGSLYECKECGTVRMVPTKGMSTKTPVTPSKAVPEEDSEILDIDTTPIEMKGPVSTEKMDDLIRKVNEQSKKPLILKPCSKALSPVCIKGSVKKGHEGHDAVNNPYHYTAGRKYEPIDVAEDWGLDRDAYLFNALKYIARAGRKGDALEDLQKAQFYLDRKVKKLMKKE